MSTEEIQITRDNCPVRTIEDVKMPYRPQVGNGVMRGSKFKMRSFDGATRITVVSVWIVLLFAEIVNRAAHFFSALEAFGPA